MMVLQHDHPLSLIDLNPKYPHDEEVYDDEEDLIIKQAFQSSCGRCHQEITYYHRYYYKCDQCDYSLHKLCGEVPVELQHASHSAHILTLFLDELQGQCHICKSFFQSKQLRYHCSSCMFNICLGCGMGEVQYLTIYHPSHQHPLIPICRQRQILAECDACGEQHKGVFYHCFTCFSFSMHSDCVFKPKRLLIQVVTSGRFLHTHPLIPTYTFPRVYQKEKFDPTCRVCENSFYDSQNLWVYRCEKCRYYVHLKCTNLRCEPSSSGTVGTLKNYQDNSLMLHAPFFDQIQNIFTKLFARETNAKSITHASHEHPLILVDTMTNVEDLCNGCWRPIMDMPFYMCNTYKCKFVLHELCTRLPGRLEGHTDDQDNDHSLILHLPFFDQTQNMFTKLFSRETNAKSITHASHEHPLILVDTMTNVEDLCNGCWRPIMDMPFYKCNTYKCKFVLHELCTRLPGILEGHTDELKHTLRLWQNTRRPNAFCVVCNHFCKGFSYSCLDCKFNYKLDVSCALLIETVTHKSHPNHPLSRTEKRLHKNYCRMCLSGFRSKEESSFSCGICNFHLHRDCALLLPETIRHKYDKHPMTLSYSPIENHEGDYFCEVCEEELNPYISFYHCDKCVQFMHSACAQLKPLPKSYNLYGLSEKRIIGADFNTRLKRFHEHPLSFANWTPSDDYCRVCLRTMRENYILKCPRCNFKMHEFHLLEEE